MLLISILVVKTTFLNLFSAQVIRKKVEFASVVLSTAVRAMQAGFWVPEIQSEQVRGFSESK